jgi:hypothetical protein
MPLPATLPAAILETILTGLATLFLAGAGGDPAAARHAALHMLGAYRPETEDELRLAALGQAAAPDLPLTRILRLRSGAVSLSRESAKAERRLGQLQKARQQGIQAQPAEAGTADAQPVEVQPEPAQPAPRIEKALAPIQDTGAVATAAKANGVTWTRAYEDRQRDQRIAASIKRAEARVAAQANAAIQGPVPDRHSGAMAG